MEYGLNYLKGLFSRWHQNFWTLLPKIFFAVLILVLFIIIAKSVKKITHKFASKIFKRNQNMISMVSSFAYFIVLLFGIMSMLEFIGLEEMVTKILAGAGIIGIIAGFAFKDVASNLFVGILLKIQNPFSKQDWVEIGAVYGEVLEVGWIMTRVHTIAGQEVFIPNQLIYSNAFTNYTTYKRRRVIMKSGVSYGDDLEKVRRVAIDEVNNMQYVIKSEDIDFYFVEIGSSSYNFEIRFWINFYNNKDYLQAMSEVIMKIKKRFEIEDINIAYEVTTLDFGGKGGVNLFDKNIMITEDTPTK